MIDVGIYVDSMLMDLEVDRSLIAVEMTIACEDVLEAQMYAGKYWDDVPDREGFTLHTSSATPSEALSMRIERNV